MAPFEVITEAPEVVTNGMSVLIDEMGFDDSACEIR